MKGRGQGEEILRRAYAGGIRRLAEETPQDLHARQGRQGRGRTHRSTAAVAGKGRHPDRRRQQPFPRHHPPHPVRRKQRIALHRHRRVGRRGRRVEGSVDDARRQPGRVAAREEHFSGDLRQDARRRTVLRLDGRERRRPFRQDGPQRDRVRRHADDLRDLRPDEARPWHDQPGDARGFRGVEQGRTRQLPDRDHPRHPRLQGRRPAPKLWT